MTYSMTRIKTIVRSKIVRLQHLSNLSGNIVLHGSTGKFLRSSKYARK
jgi:hypothetical protein